MPEEKRKRKIVKEGVPSVLVFFLLKNAKSESEDQKIHKQTNKKLTHDRRRSRESVGWSLENNRGANDQKAKGEIINCARH